MKTIEQQLEEANAKLAAAEEKLANVKEKEFTLQDAAKLIKERPNITISIIAGTKNNFVGKLSERRFSAWRP
jgi:uncharacterized ferredoxin-like protein